jgi:hypothetical protein
MRLDEKTSIVKGLIYFAYFGIYKPDFAYHSRWRLTSELDHASKQNASELEFCVDVRLTFSRKASILACVL